MKKIISILVLSVAPLCYGASFDYNECNKDNYEKAMRIAYEYLPYVHGEYTLLYDGYSEGSITFGGLGLSFTPPKTIIPWIQEDGSEPISQYELDQRIKELESEINNNQAEIARRKKQLEVRKKRDEDVLWAKKIIYKCLIAEKEEPCQCKGCSKYGK